MRNTDTVSMHSIIVQYLTFWRPLGYVIVFLGMVLEGDSILFTAAFLTHQKLFDVGDMLPTIAGGVLIGDLFWYWLGVQLNITTSRLGRWASKVAAPFDEHLRRQPFRTLLISKFTYGVHHAILLRTGAIGFGFKQFIKREVVANAVWILVVGGLGYAASASLQAIRHYLRFAELALLLGLLGLAMMRRLAASPLKKKL